MIADKILDQCKRNPSRTAVSFLVDARIHSWTFQELASRCFELRDGLQSEFRQRGAVAIVMSTHADCVAAVLAADLAGRAAVLLSTSLPQEERSDVLLHTSPVAKYVPSSLALRKEARWEASPPAHRKESQVAEELGSFRPGDFVCQLTSGSMGNSRLAVRTRTSVQIEIESVTGRLELTDTDCVLCASSIAHSYSLVGGLLAPLTVGAGVALASSPQEAIILARVTKPTILYGLASTYQTMLDVAPPRGALARLRLAVSAGAPLTPGLLESCRSIFQFSIRQDYGTTETGTITIDNSSSVDEGCVGSPLDHVDIKIDPTVSALDDGDHQGEILVRTAAVARGYLMGNRVDSCVDADGWYHTRDAGHRDGRGRLWLNGRVRERVEIRGQAVDLDEVERVISAMPRVVAVVVVARKGKEAGCQLKAVVTPATVDPEAVRAWCSDRLPPHSVPSEFEVTADLPRSPAGKVLQKYL